MKIFIDAGHNYSGWDTGAEGHGLREREITFYIANGLKHRLQAQNIEVKMSREALDVNLGYNEDSSLNKRAEIANKWGADLFISIHCNAFNEMAFGTETFCFSRMSEGEKLATKVQNRIVSVCKTYDRGVKTANYRVLKNTNMPAILVETAFIDNQEDAIKLGNNSELFAKAIYEGVLEYMGIKETVKEEETKVDVSWYNDAQYFVMSAGISDGQRPGDPVTRAEAWAMIQRLASYIEKQL